MIRTSTTFSPGLAVLPIGTLHYIAIPWIIRFIKAWDAGKIAAKAIRRIGDGVARRKVVPQGLQFTPGQGVGVGRGGCVGCACGVGVGIVAGCGVGVGVGLAVGMAVGIDANVGTTVFSVRAACVGDGAAARGVDSVGFVVVAATPKVTQVHSSRMKTRQPTPSWTLFDAPRNQRQARSCGSKGGAGGRGGYGE